MKTILICMSLIVVSFSCGTTDKKTDSDFIVFNGVEMNTNETALELITKPHLTGSEKSRLAAVFVYYGWTIKYENGLLLIPEEYIDTDDEIELLWNFTTKANDKEWFDYHVMERESINVLQNDSIYHVKIENNTDLNSNEIEEFNCCSEDFSLDDNYCNDERIESTQFVPFTESPQLARYLMVTMGSFENDSIEFNLELFDLVEASEDYRRTANFGSKKISTINYVDEIRRYMCLFVNK
ncbi:MAG: hypothetical protein GQ574_10335 [Crocinitomix sp.]|nr:hypothetical protein [Crocinitomix sp.]